MSIEITLREYRAMIGGAVTVAPLIAMAAQLWGAPGAYFAVLLLWAVLGATYTSAVVPRERTTAGTESEAER